MFGRFFSSGQRWRFQRRMAASSRSRARPAGRWQLQPNWRSNHQTCRGENWTPHWCAIKSRTRRAVHNSVAYPKAPGPRLSACSIRPRCSSVKRGLRPGREARSNPWRPWASTSRAQRLTDWRCAPTWRATSAWLTPRDSSRAARSRRRSRPTKSLLTPRGFPMPERVTQKSGIVTILYHSQ